MILTNSERIGKKLGTSIGTPKYCCALLPSNLPYAAFAGRVHGGLFPEPTLMPPRNTGWNLHHVVSSLYIFNYGVYPLNLYIVLREYLSVLRQIKLATLALPLTSHSRTTHQRIPTIRRHAVQIRVNLPAHTASNR